MKIYETITLKDENKSFDSALSTYTLINKSSTFSKAILLLSLSDGGGFFFHERDMFENVCSFFFVAILDWLLFGNKS